MKEGKKLNTPQEQRKWMKGSAKKSLTSGTGKYRNQGSKYRGKERKGIPAKLNTKAPAGNPIVPSKLQVTMGCDLQPG
eukprot:1159089-Pelagomonas_calceolata.AAC.1